MKTFDKKDVYTCVTAEEAKKYVGELGYPSNSLNKLKTLINNFAPYSLDKIDLDNDKPFFYREDGFLFFLPADKVKEVEEKKYRPFTDIEEFLKLYKVGQVVHIRPTDDRVEEETLIIALFPTCTNCVCFGSMLNAISLEDLFECYEIKLNGKWQPFGVAE